MVRKAGLPPLFRETDTDFAAKLKSGGKPAFPTERHSIRFTVMKIS